VLTLEAVVDPLVEPRDVAPPATVGLLARLVLSSFVAPPGLPVVPVGLPVVVAPVLRLVVFVAPVLVVPAAVAAAASFLALLRDEESEPALPVPEPVPPFELEPVLGGGELGPVLFLGELPPPLGLGVLGALALAGAGAAGFGLSFLSLSSARVTAEDATSAVIINTPIPRRHPPLQSRKIFMKILPYYVRPNSASDTHSGLCFTLRRIIGPVRIRCQVVRRWALLDRLRK